MGTRRTGGEPPTSSKESASKISGRSVSSRVVSLYWLRSSGALRRVAERVTGPQTRPMAGRAPGRAPTAPAGDDRLGQLRQIYPAEVAALIDLGLSDGAVAAYLLDADDVATPRGRTPPANLRDRPERAPLTPTVVQSRAPVLYRALGRVSAAAMRQQARQLIAASRRGDDVEQCTGLAAHAFELAQAAESLERRAAQSEPRRASEPETANVNAELRDNPTALKFIGMAPRWRKRAEEYRAVADALPRGAARESYLHLARAYETLAEQWEARARRDALLRSQADPGA